jgi:hypothetical protein
MATHVAPSAAIDAWWSYAREPKYDGPHDLPVDPARRDGPGEAIAPRERPTRERHEPALAQRERPQFHHRFHPDLDHEQRPQLHGSAP